jgi:hypothetical protein
MISIGGIPDEDQLPANWVDPWTNGMQVFDMTDLFWTDAYNASAASYEAPDVVKQYYSTNSRYPVSWVDPKLADIFQTSTTSSRNSSSLGPSLHKSNTGAIVGGAVGGVAVLGLAAGLLALYLRSKRQQQYTVTPSAYNPSSDQIVVEADTTEKQAPAELLVDIQEQRHELETTPVELEGHSNFIAQPKYILK